MTGADADSTHEGRTVLLSESLGLDGDGDETLGDALERQKARIYKMAVLFSIEKRKTFNAPPDKLFRVCQEAVGALGLEIVETNQSSGIIEARKTAPWPFKSKETLSLKVTSDSRVVVVAKVDMEKAVSSEDLVVDRFLDSVKKLIENDV